MPDQQEMGLKAHWKCMLAISLVTLSPFQYGLDFGIIGGLQAMVGFLEVNMSRLRSLQRRLLTTRSGLRKESAGDKARMEYPDWQAADDIVTHGPRRIHWLLIRGVHGPILWQENVFVRCVRHCYCVRRDHADYNLNRRSLLRENLHWCGKWAFNDAFAALYSGGWSKCR